MKKLYIIIGICCLLILLGFCYVVIIGNSIKSASLHISETIKDSKEIKAFEAEYKLISPIQAIADSLIKNELGNVNLTVLEYWIEKKWGVDYEYIFIEKIKYSKDKRLHISGPTPLKDMNHAFPFVSFRIKDSISYSRENGNGGTVCLFDIAGIPKTITLEVYIDIDHSTNKFIGDIVIEKISQVSS